MTSSPYKQSLIDNINDQKEKPSKANKKPLGKKKRPLNQKGGKKGKVAKFHLATSENEENSQL